MPAAEAPADVPGDNESEVPGAGAAKLAASLSPSRRLPPTLRFIPVKLDFEMWEISRMVDEYLGFRNMNLETF